MVFSVVGRMRNLAAQESNAVVVRGQTSSLQPSLVQDGWSQHKSKILRLYMEENRSLNEVMDIMEKEDGFTATYDPSPASVGISTGPTLTRLPVGRHTNIGF